MVKFNAFCSALLFAVTSQAQITIGLAEMPAANDQLVQVKAVTNPFINYAATGAGFTWNFPNLSADGDETTNYRTVASTNFVYAIVYADIFFNSDRANHAEPGTDIAFSQFLPIEDPYTFRYRSNSQYKTVGFGAAVSGIPIPIVFDQHDVIYELPLAFGNTSFSASSYSVDIPSVGSYRFEQDRSNEVDGWGVITTPGGVFDVLRVRTTLDIRDSLLGVAVNRPVVREYKWLAQGLRVPVMQVNTTSIFGAEVVTAIYYYDVPRSVEVAAPLATTLCPGAQVPVNFTTTGAFNAGGFFVPANQFTAQLSDANGSFSVPVDIGSVTGTESGTIQATIPSDTPLGTGYRIRVISSSPDFVGASNTFNISIGGTTEASISAQGATGLCTGGSVVLTAVGGPSYQWRLNGEDITDATDAMLTATEAGTYTVLVENACGSATSNAIEVELNPVPTHSLDDLLFVVCEGASVSFTAHDESGQADLTYQWLLNDAPIVGANDSTVEATLSGLYTVVVSNMVTGCAFTSEAVEVLQEQLPVAVVVADGATGFCEGDSVTLSAGAGAGSSFQWYMNGTPLPEATEATWVVSTAGDFTLVTTSASGCASAPSEVVVISVETVSAANVLATEPTTFCAGGGTMLVAEPMEDVDYQWLESGGPIDGASGTQLIITSSGSYSLMVTTPGGCSATSAAIEVVAHPLPDVPVITLGDDALQATGTGTFQWRLNGEAIVGATASTWVPQENGPYTVEVTDENGCTAISEPYVMITTGIAHRGPSTLRIMPNPSQGSFMIELAGAEGQAYEIMDATGKQVHTGGLIGSRTAIDMHDMPVGVYFLRVLDGINRPVLRIAITR